MADRAVPNRGDVEGSSSDNFAALMNYQFGNNNAGGLGIVWWLSYIFCTLAVVLRVCARIYVGPSKGLKIDDYMLFFALLLFSVATSLGACVIHLGYGTGVPKAFVREHTIILKMIYIGGLLGIVAIAVCKLSLGMLYWYLLKGIHRLRWLAVANIAFIVISTTATILWRVLCCLAEGVQANWDVSADRVLVEKQIKCTVCNFYMINGQYIITILSDIFFIALAIPLLRRADLSRHEKLGVFAMFALTGLTIVASIIRETVMFKNRDLMLILTWGFVETSLSIIVTSAIAMRALANTIRKHISTLLLRRSSPSEATAISKSDDKVSLREITDSATVMVSKKSSMRREDPVNGFPTTCYLDRDEEVTALKEVENALDEEGGYASLHVRPLWGMTARKVGHNSIRVSDWEHGASSFAPGTAL